MVILLYKMKEKEDELAKEISKNESVQESLVSAQKIQKNGGKDKRPFF